MTQVFDESGVLTPVTVIKVDENTVVGERTAEKNGYSAVVLGYGDIKKKHVKIALAVLAVAVLLFVVWAVMEKNAAESQRQSAEMAMASANNARGHHKHGKHAREHDHDHLQGKRLRRCYEAP